MKEESPQSRGLSCCSYQAPFLFTLVPMQEGDFSHAYHRACCGAIAGLVNLSTGTFPVHLVVSMQLRSELARTAVAYTTTSPTDCRCKILKNRGSRTS